MPDGFLAVLEAGEDHGRQMNVGSRGHLVVFEPRGFADHQRFREPVFGRLKVLVQDVRIRLLVEVDHAVDRGFTHLGRFLGQRAARSKGSERDKRGQDPR